jgi:hypothetical protein
MATLISKAEKAAYQSVRRTQAVIAAALHFNNGDLSKLRERETFQIMARRLASYFFHKSVDCALFSMVQDLYLGLLIMAPLLQRLPSSIKFDWHRGHLLGWIRRNTSGTVKRYYFGIRTIARIYDPERLRANLELMGCHDTTMIAFLLELYRQHYGGYTLRSHLAHQLFDPIMLLDQKQGFELRHGNRMIRLEKEPFEGCIDLRQESATLLDYRIQLEPHRGGQHLLISIADGTLADFINSVNAILYAGISPERKLELVDKRINDLTERIRQARSAKPQVRFLKHWIRGKLRGLAGTKPEANLLPNVMMNRWLQRVDHRLYLSGTSFFFSPCKIDEITFRSFFSPYREQ